MELGTDRRGGREGEREREYIQTKQRGTDRRKGIRELDDGKQREISSSRSPEC